MKCTWILLLLLSIGAARGSAQTPEQSLESSLQRAAAAGVPLELLESKIAEGKAKGVPLARIASAVERRLELIQRARAIVEPRHSLTNTELGVAADAVQAGVSDHALRSLAATAPPDRRAVAIATLAQLVQLGQSSDVALRNVTAAMGRGPEALMSLPVQAAAAAKRRGPPASVPGKGNPGGGPPTGKPDRDKPKPKPPSGP